MNIFTYGSLMFADVWRIVAGREFETISATSPGYSIFRVREEAFPGITAAADDAVRGLVYLDVDSEAIARLDRFEGEIYKRQQVQTNCIDGTQRIADTFVIADDSRHLLTSEMWTAEWFVASGGLAEFIARYQGFSWLGGAG